MLPYVTTFHCDSADIMGVGVSLSGLPYNSGGVIICPDRRWYFPYVPGLKSVVYLLAFNEREQDEIYVLDSSVIDLSKPPMMLEYPGVTSPYNVPYEPGCLPVYEMLFSKVHTVRDSFCVAVSAGHFVTHYLPDSSLSVRCFNHAVPYEVLFVERSAIDVVYQGAYDGWCPPNHLVFNSYEKAREGFIHPIRAVDCPKMQGVHIDSASTTQTWLSWPSVDSASSYRVEYIPHGGHFGDGPWVDSIADTSYCIQNMDPGTAYDIYVQAYCPHCRQYGLPSEPVYVSLDDEIICPTAQGLRMEWHSYDMATIVWDSLDRQLSYQLSYGPYGSSPDDNPVYNIAGCTVNIPGLDTSTYYAAYIRAKCRHECLVHDSIVWSPWSEPFCFFLGSRNPLTAEPAPAAPAFTVSPNPAHGLVTVTLGMPGFEHAALVLRDASGKELRRLTPSASKTDIPLRGLPAGTYFLTLSTPQGSSTQKLLVE